MKSIDHKNLAKYLLDSTVNNETKWHRAAFILGCIVPDYIPITYMRGCLKSKEFKGHNTENIKGYIEKRMQKLEKRELKTSADFFNTGILIHYIADSFTHAHNKTFYGSVRDHIAYEAELHQNFDMILIKFKEEKDKLVITELFEYLKQQHSRYDLAEQSFANDCNYILSVCWNVFITLLTGVEYQSPCKEKVTSALIANN